MYTQNRESDRAGTNFSPEHRAGRGAFIFSSKRSKTEGSCASNVKHDSRECECSRQRLAAEIEEGKMTRSLCGPVIFSDLK